MALGFLISSFLADWPATKICCVAAWTSSSNIEYFFARLNRSSMVTGGFFGKGLEEKCVWADTLLKDL